MPPCSAVLAHPSACGRAVSLCHPPFPTIPSLSCSGAIPVDELEDLFSSAGLLEARTEVGKLSYDADADGNGALSFEEFVAVLDKLWCVNGRHGWW
jgi:hypothetical protein